MSSPVDKGHAKFLQMLVVIIRTVVLPTKNLSRYSMPGVFYWGWSYKYPSPSSYLNCRLPEGKQGVQHKLYLFKQFRHSEPLLIQAVLYLCRKLFVSRHQPRTLQADLSKDWLRAVVLIFSAQT